MWVLDALQHSPTEEVSRMILSLPGRGWIQCVVCRHILWGRGHARMIYLSKHRCNKITMPCIHLSEAEEVRERTSISIKYIERDHKHRRSR